MRGRLTARLLAAAQIQDGENVLDIGCGCGDATILAARAAGSGQALGADLSRIQIAEARRLAASAGVTNARFEVADAQVHPFPAGNFDLMLSNDFPELPDEWARRWPAEEVWFARRSSAS